MKKYVFKPYHDYYPTLFDEEKQRLNQALGKGVIIEHVGSTAIPGLGGKGIIDIYVAVPKEKLTYYSQLIQQDGYEQKDSGGDKERVFHQKDLIHKSHGVIRYHLHLGFPESKSWKQTLAFRDYLKGHPEDVKKYTEIKKEAASKSDQIKEKYMAIKEPFIKEILKKIKSTKD